MRGGCRDGLPRSGHKICGCHSRLYSREPRQEFFAAMDAANVDLKGFTEAFLQEAMHINDRSKVCSFANPENEVH